MADGFLGRWSQRKQAAREGKPVPDVLERTDPFQASVTSRKGLAPSEARLPATADAERPTESALPATKAPEPAPPTMQDVAALHAESDFKPFVARAVAPEVRNAAMKKLFTDPHFNVMDGLDIYIDDYSIPDPLPASMLRKMASAQFLKLFDEEEAPPVATEATAAADPLPAAQQVAPVEDVTAQAQSTIEPDAGATDPERPHAAVTPHDKTDPTA